MYMDLILAKNDSTFWYKSVISSVEVYDKQIITCHFSYHTLYQPSFIYHPLSLSALGLMKGMIWKMPCNNIFLSHVSQIWRNYKYIKFTTLFYNNFLSDIDECSGSGHGCQVGCDNLPGTYRCTCLSDYQLDADQRSCRG